MRTMTLRDKLNGARNRRHKDAERAKAILIHHLYEIGKRVAYPIEGDSLIEIGEAVDCILSGAAAEQQIERLEFSLAMVEPAGEEWVNLWRDGDRISCGRIFESEAEARQVGRLTSAEDGYLCTIRLPKPGTVKP